MKNQSKKDRSLWIILGTFAVLIAGTVIGIVLAANQTDAACDHLYSDFVTTKEASEFKVGERKKHCEKCGEEIVEQINATVKLPQLYLDGSVELISKTTECMMKATYFEDAKRVESYATIKHQGHTSMMFEKKNYTIKFYENESRGTKNKISVNDWEPTHKYCLKANYIDYSSARNVVSANIWSEVVASRKQINENIASLEHYGAIDGFPVALFINGAYQGLYTFNVAKDEDTYKIADDENEAMFVINSAGSDAANFKAEMTDEDKKSVFDLEYSYKDNDVWPYERMNVLLRFVKENDGEAFRAGIGKYLDVDAAIDYLITAYVLGVTDNFSKNMILLTYDGTQWIPNMYDLDTACGLSFDGSAYLEPTFALPSVSESGVLSSGTENLLWDKFLNCFTAEFKSRYLELRGSILKNENIIAHYAEFIEGIPPSCYREELNLYPNVPMNQTDQLQQITAFLTERSRLLDAIIHQF